MVLGGSRSSSQILVAMGPPGRGGVLRAIQKGGGSEALSLGGPQSNSKTVVEVRLLGWGVLSWGRKTWWKRGPLVWGFFSEFRKAIRGVCVCVFFFGGGGVPKSPFFG